MRSSEVADVSGLDVTAFDLDNDAFCFAGIVVNKNLDAVDAFVRTFLAGRPVSMPGQRQCRYQRQRRSWGFHWYGDVNCCAGLS